MELLGYHTKFGFYLKKPVGKRPNLLKVRDFVMPPKVYLEKRSVSEQMLSGNSDEILKTVQSEIAPRR
jgi:hypothetical protein